MSSKQKSGICAVTAILTAVLMVLTSELIGEKEIIFPEIAALALGAFVCPRMPWKVTPLKMLVLMSLSAWLGYALSMADFLPMTIRVVIAFAFCSISLYVARSTMLPMISAGILPILTHTESLVYPVSVIVLTGWIILVQSLLNHFSVREKDTYHPQSPPVGEELRRVLCLAVILTLMTILAVFSGWTYLIAPPLIVAFAESSYEESPVRKVPVQICLAVFGCALIGSVARTVCCIQLHMPLTLGVLVSAGCAMLLLLGTKKLFPPAAALAVLPFIIPESAVLLYPLQVGIGVTVFMAASMLYGRLAYRRHAAETVR